MDGPRRPSRTGCVRHHGLDLVSRRVPLESVLQSSDRTRTGITSFGARPSLRLAEELAKLVELSYGRGAGTPEPVDPLEPVENRLVLVHVLSTVP